VSRPDYIACKPLKGSSQIVVGVLFYCTNLRANPEKGEVELNQSIITKSINFRLFSTEMPYSRI